jgi:hypothetical protein
MRAPTRLIELTLTSPIVGGTDILKSNQVIEWDVKRSIGGDSVTLSTSSAGDQQINLSPEKSYFITAYAHVEKQSVFGGAYSSLGSGSFYMNWFNSSTGTEIPRSDGAYPIIYHNATGSDSASYAKFNSCVGHACLTNPTYPIDLRVNVYGGYTGFTVLTDTHMVILEA